MGRPHAPVYHGDSAKEHKSVVTVLTPARHQLLGHTPSLRRRCRLNLLSRQDRQGLFAGAFLTELTRSRPESLAQAATGFKAALMASADHLGTDHASKTAHQDAGCVIAAAQDLFAELAPSPIRAGHSTCSGRSRSRGLALLQRPNFAVRTMPIGHSGASMRLLKSS